MKRSLPISTALLAVTAVFAQTPPTRALPAQTIAQKNGITDANEKKSAPAPTPPPAATSTTTTSSASLSTTSATTTNATTPPPPLAPAISSQNVQASAPASAFVLSEETESRPSLRLGFGYVHSRWSQFSSRIKDGSVAFDIGFEREWAPNVESGLHLNFLSTTTDATANENVRAFHLAFVSRYLLMPGNVKPFVALGLGVGGYRAWSLGSEFPTSITYLKHGSGTLVGVLPEVGLRFVTGSHYFFDLSLGYTGYVDSPQWKVGGWNFLLAFGLKR